MEVELIKRRLKSILKTKKISYKDLAKELKMSESGVKKLFSAPDLSLKRLGDICKILGVPLVDLISSAPKAEMAENYRLDPNQEDFFKNNWDYFAFYWLLCIDERELEEIKKSYGISDKRATQYLLKLDELGVVEYHTDEKIYHRTNKVLCFEDDSEFNNYMTNKFSVDHLLRCQKEIGKENIYQGFHTIKLRKSTFNEFKTDLANVVKKYMDRLPVENLLDEKDRKMLCFTLALSHDSYIVDEYFK